MSERIFVLEDNEERQKWFRDVVVREDATLDIAVDVATAKEMLKQKEYTMMFLDHDLGGEIFVDIEKENTGTQLAKWLVENGLQKGAEIILHSQNPVGAEAMYNLFKYTGYQVIVMPFTQLYIEFKEFLKEDGKQQT